MIARIFAGLLSLRAFQAWLRANGYAYLEDGVGNMDAGEAVLTIAKRAGVRGLNGSDSIAETLPMIQDLIKLRCRPVSER